MNWKFRVLKAKMNYQTKTLNLVMWILCEDLELKWIKNIILSMDVNYKCENMGIEIMKKFKILKIEISSAFMMDYTIKINCEFRIYNF